MLQYLHDRVKGWFAYIFGIIIALTFGLLGIERYLFNNEVDRNIVTVNGEDMSVMEFDRAFERVRMQRQQALGKVITDQHELQSLRKDLLENLILKKQLVQTATDYGIVVSDEEVNHYITHEIPSLQVDGKFSNERYNQLLRSYNFTPHTFKSEVHDELLVGQLQASVEKTQFALPTEIRFAYALGLEKRDFRYLEIAPKLFADNITVTESQLKEFYQQHQEDYIIPEKVSIEYLSIRYQDIVSKINVTDEDVKAYYQQNKDNYRTPAQWRIAHILISDRKDSEKANKQAQDIYQKLKSGADFSALAKQHSSDVISKNKGGELPWLTVGTLDESIDNVLLTSSVGDLSQPFKSKYGYEIIKVLDKRPSTVRPFDEVKKIIAKSLQQEQAQRQFAEISDELANLTFTEPTSLNGAAEALKLTLKSTEPFAANNTNKDLTHNPKIIRAAFSPDVLLQGNNSDIIPLDQTTAVVLRVKKHFPQRTQSLAQVKQDITQRIKQQIMKQRATAYAERIKNAKQKQPLLEAKKLKWIDKKAVDRRGESIDSQIVDALFQLPVTLQTEQQSRVIETSNGTIALVQLIKSHPGKIEKLEKKQVLSIARQVAQGFGAMDYQSLITSIKDHGVVKHHKHK